MRILAGADSEVHFTHLSKASAASLPVVLGKSNDQSLAKVACHTAGVLDLVKSSHGATSLQKVCLLDPKAELPLSPEDGDGRFEWFLFGVSYHGHLPSSCY